MKKFFKQLIFISSCLFFIPFFTIYATGYDYHLLQSQLIADKKEDSQEDIAVIDKEHLVGVLAHEVPYTYEYENLKAQAVVMRTHLLRRKLGLETNTQVLSYTKEEMQGIWKDDFNTIYATYMQAVEETGNKVILYKGEPIQALYHNASAGMTRNAKDVYEIDVPYLQSIKCELDQITKQVEIPKKEVVKRLKENYPNILVDENYLENQIQVIEKDSAEYIKNIQIGNIILTGEQFKNILHLPSSHFKYFTQDDKLLFDVQGVGHGVGISQNGSNELAKTGKNYKEIIQYYYKGVTIENYSMKK